MCWCFMSILLCPLKDSCTLDIPIPILQLRTLVSETARLSQIQSL